MTTFQYIMMGAIIFVLGSMYAAMLWTERDNKRLKKKLSAKK